MKTTFRMALVAAGSGLSTIVLGWWAIAPLGIACALRWESKDRPVLLAAGGAAIGWIVLLNIMAAQGPVGDLAVRTSAAMGLPGVSLFVLVVAFPAVVAGSAAWWTQEMSKKFKRSQPIAARESEGRAGVSEV